MINNNKKYLSTIELAKILGVSRITIFNRVKKGMIKAEKIGRNFVINQQDLPEILGNNLTRKDKEEIEKAVKKTVAEYGETLKLLGKE
ncbi:MAG: Molybdate-binding protein [Candidatus Magasanikbacteria bacterium GW2011_GWC2_40_17]|uniref:Molybdate-binding protein n=1 Tax=Candidatus Magasanikbacteria bacterium GW2011_GWA2_42_32 TaxID=1619039 RepID=A0A0G1CFI8_9BACT|nr:MAG: Molybdate-binding protein [Candidatus Magasanikbacteria bacterium GW2011_GWC2_40_17]KKS57331.1 MAG: Molybdate-binding protein [Candidatus Magasanikbacteria bacterium GW2011_GWA2_42_32]OGH85813.1 MAG: hypothetical protein A2294_02500 [Candidatus Magasanikbacteria bacterium RIFOXYB2_FULL_38_10]